jgi:hypothetical protein
MAASFLMLELPMSWRMWSARLGLQIWQDDAPLSEPRAERGRAELVDACDTPPLIRQRPTGPIHGHLRGIHKG